MSKKVSVLIIAAFAAALALALAGCGGQGSGSASASAASGSASSATAGGTTKSVVDAYGRTVEVPAHAKPSVYVGAVNYKGAKSWGGTYAHYACTDVLGANNVADQTGQNGAIDVDLDQIDWSQLEIDERDILDAMNAQKLFDAVALASLLDPEVSGLQLTADQQAKVSALTGSMVADFTAYAVGEGATAEDLHDPTTVDLYWKEYLKTDEGQQRMTELDLLVGQSYGDVVRGQLEAYLQTVYAEVLIEEAAADIIDQALDDIAKELGAELERQLPAIIEQLGTEIEAAVVNVLDRVLIEVEKVVTGIANTVATEAPKIIQINLNEEDLVAKQHVVSIITGYNERMERAGMSWKRPAQSLRS